MANFNYKRGYSVEELEVLLANTKAEREKFLASASDSGSSSRIALQDVERKINGILDALEYLYTLASIKGFVLSLLVALEEE